MRLVALLLAIVLLSGCAALRDRLEAPPIPEIKQVLPWGLSECNILIALASAQEANFADRIPEGFDVLSLSEIPGFPIPPQLPTQARGDANIGVEVFRCASGVGVNATTNLTDVAYGSIFSYVRPPEDLRNDSVNDYFVKWEVLIPDEARRVLLQAEGVPAVAGNATFTQQQGLGPAGSYFQATMDLAEMSFTFDGSTGQAAAAPPVFWEFTDTGAGLVVWRTNVTSSGITSGAGSLDISAAGWVKEALGGGDRVQAFYLAGSGSLVNGTISIPNRAT